MRMERKEKVICSKGFTLVEVLIAMVIGTLVVAAVLMAVRGGQQASTGIEQKISVGQDARAAMDIMTAEIGMASYNPLGSSNIWVTYNTCQAGGTPTYKGIQNATATQLSIEMDTNETGVLGDATSGEIITYTYDGPNEQITKNINCNGPAPFLGDSTAPSLVARNVFVINDRPPGINMFRYFDGNGTEFVPMTAANIPYIRKIRVTIAVLAAAADVQGGYQRMIYSSDIIPRNHVIVR